jgi:proteasome activator subunit 4
MIANVIPLNAAFALTDPNDARYIYFLRVRERFGTFLHNASQSLRQRGEENTVDAVLMLVRSLLHHDHWQFFNWRIQVTSIQIYMMQYGDSRDKYILSGQIVSKLMFT